MVTNQTKPLVGFGFGLILSAFVALLVCMPVTVSADEPAPSASSSAASDSSEEASSDGSVPDGGGQGATEFRPSTGEEETTSGYNLMIAAYVAMWLLLFGYAFTLYRRQRTIGDELDELTKRIAAIDEELEGGGS